MNRVAAALTRRTWGLVAVFGGIGWALAPVPIMVMDLRVANAAYLVPLALLLGTMWALGEEIAASSTSLIGYLITGIGMVVLGIGSLLEALFDVATLAQRGLAQGQIFYVGLFALLLGSVFLGVGQWRDGRRWYVGPSLMGVLPLTLGGFWLFNRAGWVGMNWIPVTVPYGVAWMVLGYSIWNRDR